MGIQFDELPSWEFVSVEVSPGIYSVKAIRGGGVVGESTGGDYEVMLQDLKDWAHKIERDLAGDDSQPNP